MLRLGVVGEVLVRGGIAATVKIQRDAPRLCRQAEAVLRDVPRGFVVRPTFLCGVGGVAGHADDGRTLAGARTRRRARRGAWRQRADERAWVACPRLTDRCS